MKLVLHHRLVRTWDKREPVPTFDPWRDLLWYEPLVQRISTDTSEREMRVGLFHAAALYNREHSRGWRTNRQR